MSIVMEEGEDNLFQLIYDGTNQRPIKHAEDVAQALVCMIKNFHFTVFEVPLVQNHISSENCPFLKAITPVHIPKNTAVVFVFPKPPYQDDGRLLGDVKRILSTNMTSATSCELCVPAYMRDDNLYTGPVFLNVSVEDVVFFATHCTTQLVFWGVALNYTGPGNLCSLLLEATPEFVANVLQLVFTYTDDLVNTPSFWQLLRKLGPKCEHVGVLLWTHNCFYQKKHFIDMSCRDGTELPVHVMYPTISLYEKTFHVVKPLTQQHRLPNDTKYVFITSVNQPCTYEDVLAAKYHVAANEHDACLVKVDKISASGVPLFYDAPNNITLNMMTVDENYPNLELVLSGGLAISALKITVSSKSGISRLEKAIEQVAKTRRMLPRLGYIEVDIEDPPENTERITLRTETEHLLLRLGCKVQVRALHNFRLYNPVNAVTKCYEWMDSNYRHDCNENAVYTTMYNSNDYATMDCTPICDSSTMPEYVRFQNLRMIGCMFHMYNYLYAYANHSAHMTLQNLFLRDARRLTLREFLLARSVIFSEDRLFCEDEESMRNMNILEQVWTEYVMKPYAVQLFSV